MTEEEELENFPALKEEIENKKTKMLNLSFVSMKEAAEIEEEHQKAEEEEISDKKDKYRFAGYEPDVIDFLRRCDTDQQAEEIISFLEKKGEINKKEAKRLRKQLSEKGVRSFGPKKEENYYS
ncbi:MAG: DUF2095 family protein [Asgard group archaeon]|nr:DUF2095 family protein [Asgard group archaeon]